ncbi:unnamed protein product, partial [Adineta ricciae]
MSLVDYMDSDNSANDSNDDNDSIEVVSTYDDKENDLIDMTQNLMFTSDDESDTHGDLDFDSKSVTDHKDNHAFLHGGVRNIRSTFHIT